MTAPTLRIYLEDFGHTDLSMPDCPDPDKYDAELDDTRSVIADLCRLLTSLGGTRFVVLGFGLDPWPTTIDPDLAVVLEQLPEVVAALRRREPARLDFYEQGIERSLWFSPDRDTSSVTIVCTDLNGVPHADQVVMPHEDVVSMLWQLGSSFLKIASRLCPRTVAHPWLSTWRTALGER